MGAADVVLVGGAEHMVTTMGAEVDFNPRRQRALIDESAAVMGQTAENLRRLPQLTKEAATGSRSRASGAPPRRGPTGTASWRTPSSR
jgi:acetyl-CoA acetyltransferase